VVEQLSIDEAFLDVSDDPRTGGAVARELQTEIQTRFGLSTSWGVAPNKLVAKIATEVGKPAGIVIVPAGEAEEFLAPLPVGMLWGVGPKMQEKLSEAGIRTIGDLAALPSVQLNALLGQYGLELASRARGEDDRPVHEDTRRRSLSAERTFAQDLTELEPMEHVLQDLSDEVGRRLRKANMAGPTVRLKLRWGDFRTITRQVTLAQPTHSETEIFTIVCELLRQEVRPGARVRLLGVGVANLGPPMHQLDLFDQQWQEEENLVRALDQIRDRDEFSALHFAEF
jgi:DNA polymerase-4